MVHVSPAWTAAENTAARAVVCDLDLRTLLSTHQEDCTSLTPGAGMSPPLQYLSLSVQQGGSCGGRHPFLVEWSVSWSLGPLGPQCPGGLAHSRVFRYLSSK